MMDLAYRRIGIDFQHAMTILATVVSANHDAFVTVDAGFKAFSTDRGYGPEPAHLAARNIAGAATSSDISTPNSTSAIASSSSRRIATRPSISTTESTPAAANRWKRSGP